MTTETIQYVSDTVGISDALRDDVYFREDFVRLHSLSDEIDILSRDAFSHASTIRNIPQTGWTDLETPHGYGGPVATNEAALRDGIADWRERQRSAGRVAEFIRVHPFIKTDELRQHVDLLAFNRETVCVDLSLDKKERRRYYRKGVRHALNVAERSLTLRELEPDEWPLFRHLYEDGLRANAASEEYFFDENCYKGLLAAPWSITWVAEAVRGPVAVASFMSSTPTIGHYHLAGGNERARETNANYLLLENAFDYFAAIGCRVMHLGGGRTAKVEDELFRFKKRFSPMRAKFHIAGFVHDQKKYDLLGGAKAGKFIGYR